MRIHGTIRSAVCAGCLLLMAGCSDKYPLISTPDEADLFIGWDEGANSGEFVIHFDPYWGPLDGMRFGPARFTGGGVFDVSWSDEAWLRNFHPPTSGPSALHLGDRYRDHAVVDIDFDYFAVKDIRFNIRAEDDFDITCFDEMGTVVVDRRVPGSHYSGGHSLYPPQVIKPVPYALQRVTLQGKGIRRCSLVGRGGMLDDFTYRIDRNDLELSCVGDLGENRVTRGEQLTCTAKGSTPGDSIAVESWSFSGTDSRGQPYVFPGRDDGPITDNPWRGKMAVSGEITVRASINGGTPQDKQVPITVQAREWANEPLQSTVRLANYAEFSSHPDAPPAHPVTVHDLGITYFGGEYPAPQEPGVLAFIDDFGPNHYLAYLTRIPVELDIAIVVSPAMSRGSDFYRQQRDNVRDVAQGAPCVKSGFDRYVELILAHEGYPSTPQSHSGVFLREYRQRASERVEDLAVPNDDLRSMAQLYGERLDAVQREADAVSDNEVDSRLPVRFGCEFSGLR